MKKLLLISGLVMSFGSNAQFYTGDVVPDFTLQDINGQTHHLYEYLDQGKYVVLDISTTWCNPCWAFHLTGPMKDLWEQHGPIGQPYVAENSTNDMMLFLLEGDAITGINELYGQGLTHGNWVEGTHYPILNPNAEQLEILDQAGFSFFVFPQTYLICPNRKVIYYNLPDGINAAENTYELTDGCPPPAIDAGLGEEKLDNVSIFPNPASENVAVSFLCSSPTCELLLMDLTGKEIEKKNIIPQKGRVEARFDFNQLEKGIYLIQILTEKDKIVKTFTIQ